MEQESESAGANNHHQDLKNSVDANNGENKFPSGNKDTDSKPEERNGYLQSPSSKEDAENGSAYSSPVSPELSCAICLGPLQNKSFTDTCVHAFCFNCLVSWSKVKAECPVCRQMFKSIIHNVRSYDDYDQYYISSRVRQSSSRYPGTVWFPHGTTLGTERELEHLWQLLLHTIDQPAYHHIHNNTSSPSNGSSR